jgi:hypothetical protein
MAKKLSKSQKDDAKTTLVSASETVRQAANEVEALPPLPDQDNPNGPQVYIAEDLGQPHSRSGGKPCGALTEATENIQSALQTLGGRPCGGGRPC